jgi:hypothetical protein
MLSTYHFTDFSALMQYTIDCKRYTVKCPIDHPPKNLMPKLTMACSIRLSIAPWFDPEALKKKKKNKIKLS